VQLTWAVATLERGLTVQSIGMRAGNWWWVSKGKCGADGWCFDGIESQSQRRASVMSRSHHYTRRLSHSTHCTRWQTAVRTEDSHVSILPSVRRFEEDFAQAARSIAWGNFLCFEPARVKPSYAFSIIVSMQSQVSWISGSINSQHL